MKQKIKVDQVVTDYVEVIGEKGNTLGRQVQLQPGQATLLILKPIVSQAEEMKLNTYEKQISISQ